MEKGYREEFKGLNPHSNGDNLFRSKLNFFDNTEAIPITKIEIKKNRLAHNNRIKIFKIFL